MKNKNLLLALSIFTGQSLVCEVMAQQAAQGPIDIVANEQEFAGDSVIARGNVKVTYKDSIIYAPEATLHKDPAGNPSTAVFTGHPRLQQGTSRIDADTLTFEMVTSKIIAVGRAHSEVDTPPEEEEPGLQKTAENSSLESRPESRPETETETGTEAGTKTEAPKKADTKAKSGGRIITDSDRQEYDQATGKFDAMGHVDLKHGDIHVISDKLHLVYNAENKPETAVFTGNVTATQNKNSTCADNITYNLTTRRLQATGNVRSKVIQEKKNAPKKTESPPTAKGDPLCAPAHASGPKVSGKNSGSSAQAAQTSVGFDLTIQPTEEKPLWIYSDAQDYSRDNGRVTAHGHVKVEYGEMKGTGPNAVLLRNKEGKAEKVIFTGRSQISQPGRRWIADTITYLLEEQRVVATGNAKAMILSPKSDTRPAPPVVPTPQNTRLANPNQKIKPQSM